MSDDSLRRLSEAPLIGICSVWGLTFVAAILAVEITPRLRPPRPLPEG
jgi:hypothetical protein